VLVTYQCTAACAQCCFESSPHVKGRIPIEDLLDYIDQAKRDFPTVQLVVFSGGECFMLGKDLVRAIERASGHGFATRCVTNGYWATSRKAAEQRVREVYEAGLTELNFSTGDDHQQFVPFDRVATGAMVAAEYGIRTLIILEGRNEARFTIDDAYAHPALAAFRQKAARARTCPSSTTSGSPSRATSRSPSRTSCTGAASAWRTTRGATTCSTTWSSPRTGCSPRAAGSPSSTSTR
jgi:organic radical activating enzyme